MKKNMYVLAIAFVFSLSLYAQKTIIVNGGQFGNPMDDVTISIYDPITAGSKIIDTIHSQSAQEILIDSIYAFVAAQDSLVKYNLETEKRMASAHFHGISTKSLAVYRNYLLVGNWFGQNSSNLYIYNKNTLTLVDSIPGVLTGVSSILIKDSIALISQNLSNANFRDTMGYIARLNLNSLQLLDELVPKSYSGDIGQLIAKGKDAFIALNSVSNSILEYENFLDTTAVLINFPHDLQVSNNSQYSIFRDTLFVKCDDRIASVNLKTLQTIDSSIIDTVITAFALDTMRKQFYITQTDYFSYQQAGIYSYNGNKISNFPVGSSPEVITIYYTPLNTSVNNPPAAYKIAKLYPNPAKDHVFIELHEKLENPRIRIYGLNGQLLLEKNLNSMNKRINTSELQAGVYLLLLESDQQISTARLIIQ